MNTFELQTALLKSLGMPHSRCIEATIKLRVDEPVTIEASYYTGDINDLGELEEVEKFFTLEEKNEDH